MRVRPQRPPERGCGHAHSDYGDRVERCEPLSDLAINPAQAPLTLTTPSLSPQGRFLITLYPIAEKYATPRIPQIITPIFLS